MGGRAEKPSPSRGVRQGDGRAGMAGAVPPRYRMPGEHPAAKGGRAGRGVRLAVDVLLAAVFVALMATATVEEFAHEWLGIAAFALFAVHQVLNRRWWAGLLRGRWSALRAVGTAVNLGLLLCLVGLMASSLVLSEHAFGWLPALPGAAWARVVHLLCSYWGFVLAFAHAGLCARRYLAPRRGRLRAGRAGEAGRADGAAKANGPRRAARPAGAGRWAARLCAVAVAIAGAWCFVRLDMVAYLTLQSQFLFADPSVPLALTAAEYALVGAGIACVASALGAALRALGSAGSTGGPGAAGNTGSARSIGSSDGIGSRGVGGSDGAGSAGGGSSGTIGGNGGIGSAGGDDAGGIGGSAGSRSSRKMSVPRGRSRTRPSQNAGSKQGG